MRSIDFFWQLFKENIRALLHAPLWVNCLFLIAMGFGCMANVITWQIVYETNKGKAEDQKDSYLGWHFGKMNRIFNDYERRFPQGKKVFWFKASFVTAAMFLAGSMFAGFFQSSK